MTHSFASHDHSHCVSDALTQADTHCAENRLQLTPVRRRVLEILLRKHRAMGAYDILAVLDDEGLGSQPPVAYRALSFLVEHGFAHKVEQLNAYVACTHSETRHTPVFLICKGCGMVEEAKADSNDGPLGRIAADTGFKIEHAVIEAQGLCPQCQTGAV